MSGKKPLTSQLPLSSDDIPNPKKTLYGIIIDDIMEQIQKSDFSYEEPICTEKQLSLKYNVSRITAKRAITELEHRGILYRKRGVGSFVTKDPAAVPSNALFQSQVPNAYAFLLPFDITKGGLLDTVEVVNNTLSASKCFMGIYITNNNTLKEKSVLKQLYRQNVAGLVFYPLDDHIYLELLNSFVIESKPVIIIDKTTDCPYIHNVVSDNFEGGKLLTNHLLSLGHKNIAFLSNASIENTSSIRDRFGGYIYELKKAGITPKPNHIISTLGTLTEQIALYGVSNTMLNDTVQTLFSNGVTAIIAENDQVAYSILISCKELGLNVPRDISICGFDNSIWSQKGEIGITTVNQNFHEIGLKTAEILTKSLQDPNYPIQKCVIPVNFIQKESTAPPIDR